MNVILVDDEKYILEELTDTVNAVLPNENIHSFLKAKEALAYAKRNIADIAFLDINMIDMDGLALAKELQKLYPKINIIFTTGYSDYTRDALDMYCSAYILKPITQKKISEAITHLRYPVSSAVHVTITCFGGFEVYCCGKPISFRYTKTKELLACLVDRNGADCQTRELMAMLFEDNDKPSYFDNIRVDLLNTFRELGCADVIRQGWGRLAVNREVVSCDYFDYLSGKRSDIAGTYMPEYSFAEYTRGVLETNTPPENLTVNSI